MSDISDYNEALIAAKLTALRKLRELLRTCEDPDERFRIAKAILRIRPSDLQLPAPKAPTKPCEPPPAPAPALTRPKAPRLISAHALGTLNLDASSLPIIAGKQPDRARPPGDAPFPIALTPCDEPPQIGGPVTARPLPLPLGPPRA